MNVLMVFVASGRHYRYILIPSNELKEYDLDKLDDARCQDYSNLEDEARSRTGFHYNKSPTKKEDFEKIEAKMAELRLEFPTRKFKTASSIFNRN